jgi:hypothetical protein
MRMLMKAQACAEDLKMTELAERSQNPLPRGRPTKFTPVRIQQIRTLVEQGKSREEIAELIGVTVGSLQVTCSRLGISLRRPVLNNGTGLLRHRRLQAIEAAHNPASNGAPTKPATGLPKDPSQQQALAAMLSQEPRGMQGARRAAFALTLQYGGRELSSDLPLAEDILRQLVLEAQLRNMCVGELVGSLVTAAMEKDLLGQALNSEHGRFQSHTRPDGDR